MVQIPAEPQPAEEQAEVLALLHWEAGSTDQFGHQLVSGGRRERGKERGEGERE